MTKKGLLIVLSGPSGCGKGTILKEVLSADKNIRYSISATTRKPRHGEIDGVNYHFISTDKFSNLVENDGFLEYARYIENGYGTPKEPIEKWRNEGFDVILEIELQGAMQVRKTCEDAVFIFIMPPSLDELKTRLINRKTEDESVIERRMKVAMDEIQSASEYDYIVFNDDLNNAIKNLSGIILAERCKPKYIGDIKIN